MRAVFIFVVLIILISLTVPVTFAVRYWLDGGAVLTDAQRRGALRAPATAGRLSMAERTIAMNEFRDTWRTHATPCRTFAFLWYDLIDESVPQGVSVSQKFATALLGEQRETSIRWQIRRLIVACQLEQRFDDRRLLRMWLAHASFGRGAEGIENAAQAVFGKPSRALNAEESARLAALLRAPSLRNQPERWAERARLIQERVAVPAH